MAVGEDRDSEFCKRSGLRRKSRRLPARRAPRRLGPAAPTRARLRSRARVRPSSAAASGPRSGAASRRPAARRDRAHDYHLDLTVDPRQKSFLGHVRIGVTIERPTRAIVMHARGITVHLASVEQAGQKLWTKPRSRFSCGWQGRPGRARARVRSRAFRGHRARSTSNTKRRSARTLRGLYRVEEAGQRLRVHAVRADRCAAGVPLLRRARVQGAVRARGERARGPDGFSNTPLARKTEAASRAGS